MRGHPVAQVQVTRCWRGEEHLEVRLADLRDDGNLVVHLDLARAVADVRHEVVEGELQIVRREGHAVGPLVPLAERARDLRVVGVEAGRLRDLRDQLAVLVGVEQVGETRAQQLGGAGLGVPRHVLERAAVSADVGQRRHHERLLGEAALDRTERLVGHDRSVQLVNFGVLVKVHRRRHLAAMQWLSTRITSPRTLERHTGECTQRRILKLADRLSQQPLD